MILFCQAQEQNTDKVTHHFFCESMGHMVHRAALLHDAGSHMIQVPAVHVRRSVHVMQTPNMRYQAMVKRRKMMVHVVMMLRHMVMVLLVHMYMKLLFLMR